MSTKKAKTTSGGTCRCGKKLPRLTREDQLLGVSPYEFCSDECRDTTEQSEKPIKEAEARLTTHVDPEDRFRRTAIVLDENTSVDLVLPDGTRLATLNAFVYERKLGVATPGDLAAPPFAIIDLIIQEGAVLKEQGAGLLWFNRIGAEGSNQGAERYYSGDHTGVGPTTTIVSLQLDRKAGKP